MHDSNHANGQSAFAGIKWGGVLLVEFNTTVEPEVFDKVFDGCIRRWSFKATQEPGELLQKGVTETIDLDRDDMLRIFGKVSMPGHNIEVLLGIISLPAAVS